MGSRSITNGTFPSDEISAFVFWGKKNSSPKRESINPNYCMNSRLTVDCFEYLASDFLSAFVPFEMPEKKNREKSEKFETTIPLQ